MKVTLTCFGPSDAATKAGIKSMSPELMSAVGARYSRNDNGLDEILKLIDSKSQDASIDSIFKMVDYGHASIADMASIPVFIDGISIYLTYYIWSICPRASGQETSTRYVKFDKSGIISPELAGIDPSKVEEWKSFISKSIQHYTEATEYWKTIAEDNSDLANIPKHLIKTSEENGSESHKAGLIIARLKRNYAFDRSRYFIPAAALTNVMFVMPALDWVKLINVLGSHYIPEARLLATKLKDQLKLVIPRLMKHCEPTEDQIQGHIADFDEDIDFYDYDHGYNSDNTYVDVDVNIPYNLNMIQIENAFEFHKNRYARLGKSAQRINVRFSVFGIAMAELRDLNRHRTGYKYSPAKPIGFYCAMDQLPNKNHLENTSTIPYSHRNEFGYNCFRRQLYLFEHKNISHLYWGLLGTKYYFEHGTTLDKLAYEIALRTGTGSHWRYAEHMKKVHDKLIEMIPELDGKILVGSSEPE